MDFYSLYIDLLVTTGGIEPFVQNVDYPSMVVFLNMFFNITMRKHPNTAILNFGRGLC